MRDEHKEAEGSPETQGAARRQRQRDIAGGSVNGHARGAVRHHQPDPFRRRAGLRPGQGSAPIVLAKGRGDKALAMRELAANCELPALEYPALARSVYFTTREQQVIREELYGAIASVLAFVLSLKRGEKPPRPQIDVPVTLRFDAEGKLAVNPSQKAPFSER